MLVLTSDAIYCVIFYNEMVVLSFSTTDSICNFMFYNENVVKVITKEKCGFLEVKEGSGELTSKQFKTNMKDLTNFLAYMSDPIKEEREYIGKFVILYLLFFTILSYLLYREFKKDVH